ncbi:hypothetical protein GCM10027188_00240 [Lysobacter humi (ex Lee et al. 2017)]
MLRTDRIGPVPPCPAPAAAEAGATVTEPIRRRLAPMERKEKAPLARGFFLRVIGVDQPRATTRAISRHLFE